jgi:hypothetical protein
MADRYFLEVGGWRQTAANFHPQISQITQIIGKTKLKGN